MRSSARRGFPRSWRRSRTAAARRSTAPGARRRRWSSAALGLHAPTTLVILLAHVGDVDDFRDDVATFAGIVPEVFPAWEKLPRELNAADEVFGRRMRVLKKLVERQPAPAGRRAVSGDAAAGAQARGPGADVAHRRRRRRRARRKPDGVAARARNVAGRGRRGARRVQRPRRHPRRLSHRRDRPGPHRVLRRRDRVDPALRRRIPALARSLELGHADRRARPGRRRSGQLRPSRRLFSRGDLGHPARAGRPPRGGPALPRPARRHARALHGRAQLRAPDPLAHDRGLDPGGRLARGDLPPADREHRAVLGRAAPRSRPSSTARPPARAS